MFEKASRQKFRFITSQGVLTVEDLWDLPLSSESGRANLDDIAKAINRQLKASVEEESFVSQPKKSDDSAKTMFEIVKHIISVKLTENEAKKKQCENKLKKQQILAIIAKKQDAALEGTPLEELQKMVDEL